MEIVELMNIFSDPSKIGDLPINQRLLAGLVTTILGMGITFIALIILQIITSLFERIAPATPPTSSPIAEPRKDVEIHKSKTPVPDDEELVAAVTCVIAAVLEKPTSSIIIKNIRRIDAGSAWGQAGLAEQVRNSI